MLMKFSLRFNFISQLTIAPKLAILSPHLGSSIITMKRKKIPQLTEGRTALTEITGGLTRHDDINVEDQPGNARPVECYENQ